MRDWFAKIQNYKVSLYERMIFFFALFEHLTASEFINQLESITYEPLPHPYVIQKKDIQEMLGKETYGVLNSENIKSIYKQYALMVDEKFLPKMYEAPIKDDLPF